jgi:cyclic pyranopterin phosphate synthase
VHAATASGPAAEAAPLVDRFGRVASDLRISLTDLCSLRCTYCMPAEGLDWLGRAQRLTDAEFVRLAGVFTAHGVTSIRLTGGEPLVHPTLPDVVASLAALRPRPQLALTTNGVTLARHAQRLAAAGVERVNVSLDTLRPDRFAALTRRDRLADVLAGIAAAARAGLAPLKVNAVLVRDQNLDEARDLLAWALRNGHQLRFIEHMPLDGDHAWSRTAMVDAQEVLAELGRSYTLAPADARGTAPAELFDVVEGPQRATGRRRVRRSG